ncbi:MAG: helix-turn-helix domain-containing protein [Myxococcales bacterium]|nr:helix-turn-helix domain-containing protein [Myxococcales bacterium]
MGAFERAITLELARRGDVGPEGFRWLRKAAGLKAVRLAEFLDVTPMQVSRWENGRKPLERLLRVSPVAFPDRVPSSWNPKVRAKTLV